MSKKYVVVIIITFFISTLFLNLMSAQASACDPENLQSFLQFCLDPKNGMLDEYTNQFRPGIRTRPLYMGTTYPGHKDIDCKNGITTNTIDSTQEKYSCTVSKTEIQKAIQKRTTTRSRVK